METQGARQAPLGDGPYLPLLDPATAHPPRRSARTFIPNEQWERATTLRVITAYLAHEINHPLGAIVNLTGVIARKFGERIVRPSELNDIVADIRAEAVRATSIIRNLRLLTDGRPQARELVDVNAIVRDIVADVRPHAEAKDVRLVTEYENDTLPVLGVAELIRLAVLNLTSNAVSAMDNVRIAVRRCCIRTCERPDGFAAVKVSDTGLGVPAAIADKIFEPFFSTKPAGSGLGLAIAADVAKWHGGRIEYSPAAEGGACFVVSLRAARGRETGGGNAVAAGQAAQ